MTLSDLDWQGFWQSTADGFALVDGLGIIQAVNPAFEQLSGYSAGELCGLKIHCLLSNFSWPAFVEAGSAWQARDVQMRAKGEKRPVTVSLTPLWQQDRLQGAVLVIRDHASCHQNMRRLEVFSAAVEQSPNAVMIVDLSGRIVYVNPRFCELTGYTPREILGKDPSILKSGYTSPETYRRLREALRRGEEWRGEIQDRRKDGTLYWVFETISPIRDIQGRITHYLAIQKDITEQKQAEEALKESEARFRQIADMTGEWIWEQDAEGHYLYSSAAVEQILGYEPGEILGKHYLELFTAEDRRYWKARAPTMPPYRQRFYRVINRYRHKDGHVVYTESTGIPIFDDQGQLVKWRGVDYDITERRRAEAERHALKIARHIQQSLLPSAPLRLAGVQVAGICVPAQQVGGDYFDYFATDGGVDAVVADVSGHSVGAALIMAEARSILKVQVRAPLQPGVAELLAVLNDVLYEDLDRAELFITLFYVRYSPASRRLCYANAGHNRPLLLQQGKDSCVQLDAEGLILGVRRGVEFEEKQLTLAPGDTLLLYTDGIVEAQNTAGEFFGLRRLCKEFIRQAGKSPEAIVQGLMAAVRDFRGSEVFDDDISLVVLQVDGGGENVV